MPIEVIETHARAQEPLYDAAPSLGMVAAVLAACRHARVAPEHVLAYATALDAMAYAAHHCDSEGQQMPAEEALECLYDTDASVELQTEAYQRALQYLHILTARTGE